MGTSENDLQNVSALAREMVTRWGMSRRVGTIFFGRERDIFLGREMSLGQQQREYSEETAATIDEEVKRIISQRYQYVQALLTKYRNILEEIARRLLEKEVVDEQELRALVANVPLSEITSLPYQADVYDTTVVATATTADNPGGDGTGGANGNHVEQPQAPRQDTPATGSSPAQWSPPQQD